MKIPKIISFVIIPIIVILFFTLTYRSCVPHKLNEATFYKDDHLELKVVRYFENLPLHYNGPVFRILAKSKNTVNSPKRKQQDRGWKRINKHPGLSNLGWDPQLETLVEAARPGYKVTDQGTVIYETALGIIVTWDAYGTFRRWDVQKISEELLLPTAGYDNCLKDSKVKEKNGALNSGWGKANCWAYRFMEDSKPHFRKLEAKKEGYASFIVASKAFRDTESFIVKTHDFGKTWKMRAIEAE